MKKIILICLILIVCTGVGIAATYKVKSNGSVSGQTTQTRNLYNNYGANQYVQNNTVNSQPASIIELVMDYSGSMAGVINVAQNTMVNVVAQIPSSTKVGFRVFGQGANSVKMGEVKNVRKTTNSAGQTIYKLETGQHETDSGSCQSTKLVAPITTADSNMLLQGMQSVNIGGSTPLVLALEKAAYSDLAHFQRGIPKKIVLITDGGENCGGDPCAFAKTLMSTRRDIQIDVVLVSSSSTSLRCLATTTGGRVYSLNDINQFQNVLVQSMNTPVNNTSTNNNNTNNNTNNNQNTNKQNYEFYDE